MIGTSPQADLGSDVAGFSRSAGVLDCPQVICISSSCHYKVSHIVYHLVPLLKWTTRSFGTAGQGLYPLTQNRPFLLQAQSGKVHR